MPYQIIKEFAVPVSITSVCAFLLIYGVLFMATGCEELQTPKWQAGDFVESVLTGQQGQILSSYPTDRGPAYYVRFAVETERTNENFGGDGDIEASPFARVYMREFELRDVTD